MTSYYNNYLTHLALVKNNFPARPGDAQNIYRGLTVELLNKYYFKIIKRLDINEFYECGAHEASASILFPKPVKQLQLKPTHIHTRKKQLKLRNLALKHTT